MIAALLVLVAASATPPAPCPAAWRGLIGSYAHGESRLLIRERDGRLEAIRDRGVAQPLEQTGPDRFAVPGGEGATPLAFTRGEGGVAAGLVVGGVEYARRAATPEGAVFRIVPRRGLEALRREARTAKPPGEPGPLCPPDLVEPTVLDASIRLDIRYATSANFLGTPVYESARAFLQRPAAEALVRAHRRLAQRGYGLLLHDAYRPWWVTWLFWEATPDAQRDFVANPARGSRHNRGCAVDLSLYRLADGAVVEMPGLYDEMTERSHPDYAGGTSAQRWHRDLLREAMEAEGFTVFEVEWWHFDYRDWRSYPVLNMTFTELAPRSP